MKIFPKKNSIGWGKVINFFKPEPHEAVIIQAYGLIALWQDKLAEFINSITNRNDLREIYQYKVMHNR